MSTAAQQKQQLEQSLWRVANVLRGRMGADEYRNYILGLIFYKFLSEKMAHTAQDFLRDDGIDFATIDGNTPDGQDILKALEESMVQELGYYLPPEWLFERIAARAADGAFVLDVLADALEGIQASTTGHQSEDNFQHLFDDLDLASNKLGKTGNERNATIAKVLTELQGIDFRLDDAQGDVLGDAYEFLIGEFASGAGKKAGEFYTPQSVSTILARIVAHNRTVLRRVYDPTCGSGSLLLRVARAMNQIKGSHNSIAFYGQERNPTTFNLARMNMIMHGVNFADIHLAQGDTLEQPLHPDMRADAIVANPPFSAHWSARDSFLEDERFADYATLAPAKKADFAFVQHIFHHLAENGTAAVVLPHGVLFRGGREGTIRQILLRDKNAIDAIIGLPANIFYGTGIPTCILVLKKCREAEDILFVDASQCFTKGKAQNFLSESDIDRIVGAYTARQAESGFSHLASLDEIAGHDYNLNIPRYVASAQEEAQIDLTAITASMKDLDIQSSAIDAEIRAFCVELGLEAPV